MEKLERSVSVIFNLENKSMQTLFTSFIEEAVILTDSELGYFAVVNAAEDTLIMIGWSQISMENCTIIYHPIVYQLSETGLWGDAVRERAPVITNDYNSCSKQTKKGMPEGHVKVIRHFNIPIFDKDHVTGVVGVGNKKTDYNDTDVNNLIEFSNKIWPLIKSVLPEILLK
jgi:GAF domain-containing protein